MLRRSIVFFFDVLGTKELLREEVAQSNLERLDRALAEADRLSNFMKGISYEVNQFTDNFVFGWPLKPPNEEATIRMAINHAAILQCSLIQAGLTARGAITVGEIFIDSNIAFGPGIVSSYKLESESAVYPRVLVDKSVTDLLLTLTQSSSDAQDDPYDYLMAMDSTYSFVNYLYLTQIPSQPTNEAFLKTHREFIEENIMSNQSSLGVLEKYIWLRDYHNFYCREFVPLLTQLLTNSDQNHRVIRYARVRQI